LTEKESAGERVVRGRFGEEGWQVLVEHICVNIWIIKERKSSKGKEFESKGKQVEVIRLLA